MIAPINPQDHSIDGNEHTLANQLKYESGGRVEQLEGGEALKLAAEELSLAATEFLTEATPPPLDYHERNSPEGVVRVPDTTSTNTPRARFNRAHERLIGAQDNLAASLKPSYGGEKEQENGSPSAAKDATDDVENPGASAADGGDAS